MLVIRFQRFGKRHQPTYRVVVTEKHSKPQGKYLENLGWYDPRSKKFALREERIKYWISHGAQCSITAWNLLVRANVISGAKQPKHTSSKKKPDEAL